MKLLFISDIHGIKTNLPLIKEKLDNEKIDKLIVLGDLYYIGPRNKMHKDYDINYVKDFLESYKEKIICMKGNCDSDVDVMISDFPICDTLSVIMIDNLNLYLTHGDKYNRLSSKKFDCEGVLIYGHEHMPYIEKDSIMTYINVGSISLPKNEEATYMIYENHTFTIFGVSGKKIIETSL